MTDEQILHIVSNIATLRRKQCVICQKAFDEDRCKICHELDAKIDELVKEIVREYSKSTSSTYESGESGTSMVV